MGGFSEREMDHTRRNNTTFKTENDGITDSNSPVLYDSWFWPHIRKDLNFYVLEIYNASEDELKKQVELVSNFIQESI